MKYGLHDIRKSKVWQEAYNERTAAAYRELIEYNLKRGLTREEVATLLFPR